MKIKLSLLPKSREKKIKNNKILKFVVLQEVMIIIITLLFFVIIKGVDAIAKYQLSSVNQQLLMKELSGEHVEIKKYEENLKEAGLRIDFIKKVQRFNIDWVLVLDKLSVLLPQDSVLDAIEGNGSKLILKGIVKNRDILIKMKEDIERDDCFDNVNIPLNNIVLREDIKFELSLDVNMECLNNYEK